MPSKKRATPISLQPLDGMQIKKEDYKLVYVGELSGNMSLDDIFERFNIDRPEDFRGHSLSVSDIIVLNDGEKVTAHFVDSISFEQLDSFLNLEEQVLSELAYEVGERYFAIQRTEEGYDYSFYDEDFRLMDGGVYENDQISIEEAAEELLEDEGWTGERIRGDYDQLMEKVEEMDEVVMAEIQKSQGEYKPLAKVEELEEANYNMIDNVLNNMPPKKEPIWNISPQNVMSSMIWELMKKVPMLIRLLRSMKNIGRILKLRIWDAQWELFIVIRKTVTMMKPNLRSLKGIPYSEI